MKPIDNYSAPAWMRFTLLLAGIYNLAWGIWVIFWPMASFQWLGMDLPNYPQLWQCIGMIVGVYGIGYLIAASNPYRHWPIVLVGFLGKVFGPIGFLQALWQNDLPLAFGLHNITNDVIWWIPFALILIGAWRAQHHKEPTMPEKIDLSRAMELAHSQKGETLASLTIAAPVLLVFLRHFG